MTIRVKIVKSSRIPCIRLDDAIVTSGQTMLDNRM